MGRESCNVEGCNEPAYARGNCELHYQKAYYEKHKEGILASRESRKKEKAAYQKIYRQGHKREIAAYQKFYREGYKGGNKEEIAAYQKAWYGKNKERIVAQQKDYRRTPTARSVRNNYQCNRLRIDPQYKLASNLRTRVASAIRKFQKGKKGSAVRDLGCSMDELIPHLEALFQENMTWENYGKWHVDHILPLFHFDLTDREQFLKACHYTNLQPLWARDNLKKGNKCQSRKK